MKKQFILILIIIAQIILAMRSSAAADVSPSTRWLHQRWEAEWCAHPIAPGHEPALFLFRRIFNLDSKPETFVIHASADQRYQLYVNGERVSTGPARGDLLHWRFETVDIAPFLKAGKNLLAARVWSAGVMAPWAQITAHTAFIVQGDGELEKKVNTPYNWKVYHDPSWQPIPEQGRKISQHVTGPNEQITASLHPWEWLKSDFDDSSWESPTGIAYGVPVGMHGDGSSLWYLTPRNIPMMEERKERIAKVVRTKRVDVPDGFLQGNAPVVVPAKKRATILLDNEVMINGYPELIVSGGAGAKIRLSYEESLFKYPDVAVWRLVKGNRGEIKNCEIRENYKYDEFLPDGGKNRVFSPLWWRSFRFLQIDVETADEPVTLEDLRVIAIGYPFQTRARFDASDPSLRTIWEVGWRTVRLNAAETFIDSPYYEQLQYVGDARINSVVSYYASGDDRLARNAIEAFGYSIMPEGLIQSRFPSRMLQIIPPFALLWIGLIHDHWLFNGDDAFTQQFLWRTRSILDWFKKYRLENGLLGGMPWWNFVDWSWEGGVPPGAASVGSSIISLQYALALWEAAELEEALGDTHQAKQNRALADEIVSSVRQCCWNNERGLLSDTPEQNTFSQHASILAVLADLVPSEKSAEVIERVISDKSLAQCSLYFRYYLHEALNKAGMGERFLSLLSLWREALELGLTTWPETPGQTRSDCHGWSSAPTVHLLSIVCGVKPDANGFSSVRIEPHLSNLEWVSCEVPHPAG
ncbi:MAG: family 78 glycoside hydrolase catalytic domain, partial [bacterium]